MSVMISRINVDRATIAEFCRRRHIRRLALFGSVLRDDFRADSDIDVLVEFEREHTPGLIRLGLVEDELGELLGGRADLVAVKGLSRHIRSRVRSDAEAIHAEG
jgi:uncharacterized protein